MATAGSEYEAALRGLPEKHSLALRLTDAGVADEVICRYLDIEPECLPTLLDLARRKLHTALQKACPET
ncbi:hypothetical protein [Mycolicibacterium sphagni]|uniref:RNA polymerase sigma factor 70 region 4 type 2 domain-containing protein n=1 Tax=Mycolicibacterium sphagni TaxID=1786 RepID=A0ABX2JVL4_9MYCO|nr:hypothetical protein [Mycolicibacterium sphagni]NTY59495.1 hypothetical protein [Mycolicibacterium sphagni]